MTDVAGPPVPPLRFSSLLIRAADAAVAAGADGSNLEVNCSMAQAFEIPTGNRNKMTRWRPPAGEHRKQFPDTLSRSPLPAGSTLSTGSVTFEYGSTMGSPQACKFGSNATRAGSDSRLGRSPRG